MLLFNTYVVVNELLMQNEFMTIEVFVFPHSFASWAVHFWTSVCP